MFKIFSQSLRQTNSLLLVVILSLSMASCRAHDPAAARQQLDRGLQKAEAHDWAAALQHFDRAVKLDSTLSIAWANHGTALLNLGKPEEALKSYARAKRFNPKDPYIYCSICSANIARNKPEDAIKAAEGALAVDSTYAPAMANKANALRMLGRTQEADSLLQQAKKMFPIFRQRDRE
jgi:tetratricopeptide (TPR) repeat protein